MDKKILSAGIFAKMLSSAHQSLNLWIKKENKIISQDRSEYGIINQALISGDVNRKAGAIARSQAHFNVDRYLSVNDGTTTTLIDTFYCKNQKPKYQRFTYTEDDNGNFFEVLKGEQSATGNGEWTELEETSGLSAKLEKARDGCALTYFGDK